MVTPLSRKINQQLPELIPRHRIDARGRLVQNEHFGLVNHRDRERKSLPDAEGQLTGHVIEILAEPEALNEVHDAVRDVGGR